MKVSVIMPVFNAEKYLDESLASVLNQTLGDVNVLCVNNGSTDGSLGILQERARKDNRICLIDQPNRGPAVARNAALAQAQGEYVAFMDADDLYPAADVLERLYRAAVNADADLCGGRMEHLLPEGGIRVAENPPYWGFTTYLYRRSMLDAAKLRFPDYRVFEDPPFLVAALARAKRVARVDFATYRYRVDYRGKGKSSLVNLAYGRDYLRGLMDVVRIAREAGLDEIYAAVRSQCRSREMLGLAMELLRRDPAMMEFLCRLEATFPEGELLPFMELSGRLAGNAHTPMGALKEAVRQTKAAVGQHLPETLKFWRRD